MPGRIAGIAFVVLALGSVLIAQGPPVDQPETIWVDPGTVVWDRPGPHGVEVARVQTVAELPIRDVAPGWVRVIYLGRSGWIEQPGIEADRAGAASPCDRIDLGTDPRCIDLGWVWLMTDLSPAESAEAERLLAELPGRYGRRFGKFTSESGAAWFAVLRERKDYENFLRQYRRGLAVDAMAVASGRVAAMLAQPNPASRAAVVIHEGVHLLNRVALGDGVPVWLEEGSAGCLDLVNDEGVVRGDTDFSPLLVYHDEGWSEERTKITHGGPRAALARLRDGTESDGQAFGEVVTAGRRRFYRPSERERNYELSSLLTCYLAQRVHPAATGGLVNAWRNELLSPRRLEQRALEAEMRAWAGELLAELESATLSAR